MKQYHYEQVQKPNRSLFDLSHEKKFTMRAGYLVPCLVQEVIPGDKFNVTQEMLLRNMPLVAPIMHRINVFTHFFYVPNRVVFPKWDEFITGKEDINLPKITGTGTEWATNQVIGDLGDYMGIPVTMLAGLGTTPLNVSQLPFRAYQQIYNDYYRDQNLDAEIEFDKSELDTNWGASINNTYKVMGLRQRNLEKDYFTSGLTKPQFGDPVTLPMGGTIPVKSDNSYVQFRRSDSDPLPQSYQNIGVYGDGVTTNGVVRINNEGPTSNLKFASTQTGLLADLSLATATSISDLRRAYALQRYQELLMRGGRRLKEWTLNIFGVNVPDERIQRAEYLGGGKMPIQISEVIQTVGDDVSENPLGGLAGHGIAGGTVSGFSKYFFEHGYIIGIMSILPKTGYFQGIPKNLIKFDKFDYYTPQFAHIGEQAILQQEIALDKDDMNGTFAYTVRYAEYRDNHDTVAGEFRDSLLFWHNCKKFLSKPNLNSTFIKVDQDSLNRSFAVQSADFDKYIVQTYLKIYATRPVAKYGNPI